MSTAAVPQNEMLCWWVRPRSPSKPQEGAVRTAGNDVTCDVARRCLWYSMVSHEAMDNFWICRRFCKLVECQQHCEDLWSKCSNFKYELFRMSFRFRSFVRFNVLSFDLTSVVCRILGSKIHMPQVMVRWDLTTLAIDKNDFGNTEVIGHSRSFRVIQGHSRSFKVSEPCLNWLEVSKSKKSKDLELGTHRLHVSNLLTSRSIAQKTVLWDHWTSLNSVSLTRFLATFSSISDQSKAAFRYKLQVVGHLQPGIEETGRRQKHPETSQDRESRANSAGFKTFETTVV